MLSSGQISQTTWISVSSPDLETEASDRERVRRRREAEIDVDAVDLGRALRPGPHFAEFRQLPPFAPGEGDLHLDVRCCPSRVDRHRIAELDWLLGVVCQHRPTQAPAAAGAFENAHLAASVGALPEDGGHWANSSTALPRPRSSRPRPTRHHGHDDREGGGYPPSRARARERKWWAFATAGQSSGCRLSPCRLLRSGRSRRARACAPPRARPPRPASSVRRRPARRRRTSNA